MRKNFGSKVVVMVLLCLLAGAIGLLGRYLVCGPATLVLAEFQIASLDVPVALRLDALSSIILVMVALISAVVGQYALRHLDGDRRQWHFYRYLFVTVISVMMLVLSSNLVMFFLAWLSISWGLHHLLLSYADRPAALLAARKKFLVSRAGDLAILLAIGLLYKIFATFDFHVIFTQAETATAALSSFDRLLLDGAGLLLAMGAMTKSAQVPFHFWLPETMETSTPVSALMHAGVINAGGFLVIRLSPLIAHASAASALLALAGALTAVYGALVMATQNSIKSKLAYSTISQMGIMMFACGIGAYTVALFHIIVHSFYKAHAFLSTASLVEERKHISPPLKPLRFEIALTAIVLSFAGLAFGAVWQFGIHLSTFTYTAVLGLSLCQTLGAPQAMVARWRLLVGTLGRLVLALGIYILLEGVLDKFVGLNLTNEPSVIIHALGLFIFSAGLLLSRKLMGAQTVFARRLYMSLWNDCYLGSYSTRILWRIWSV